MANYDVKIKATADTQEAGKKLDEIEKKAQRVKRAEGSGGGGGGGGNNPPVQTPGKTGEEFGKSAGKAIGKMIVGFMAREAVTSAFAALRTPGRDDPKLNYAQGMVGSALAWGATGAAMGSVVPGIGTAAGATIGAAAGALAGLASTALEERDKAYQRSLALGAIDMEDKGRERQLDASKYFGALGLLLGGEFSQRGRKDMVGAEISAVSAELNQITDKLKQGILDRKDVGSTEMQDLQQRRALMAGRLQQLQQMQIAEDMKTPMDWVKAGEYGDTFSNRGLFVGGHVNMDDVNDRIAEINERQLDLLRQIVENTRRPAEAEAEFQEPRTSRGHLALMVR